MKSCAGDPVDALPATPRHQQSPHQQFSTSDVSRAGRGPQTHGEVLTFSKFFKTCFFITNRQEYFIYTFTLYLYQSSVYAGVHTPTRAHTQLFFLNFISLVCFCFYVCLVCVLCTIFITRMWANAQRDGRPDAYRWRPLFTAAKFG